MSIPRRALICVTSASAQLFEGGGHTTGVFISEALHPFNVLRAAGFEVDIASEKGEWTEDWLSLQPGFLTEEERKQYDDKNSEFRRKMDENVKAEDVVKNEYGVFFASAGHAALLDYPTAKNLKKIAADVWARGGIVSSVCHGPAIFPGINDAKTGESIIKGKKVTGFTPQAEDEMGLTAALKKWGEKLIDAVVEDLGGEYVRGTGVWDDYVTSEGRVITGMNPQSATSTAKEVVRVFETL
ncbi:class I glutamine amidotransferase-like protein [Massariosphaeria phaeospora]|uniref:D-lactate dehydratase n=1 Tax=Massariosphaeria phaeospora TaxID=100035 RepID=A0A7C8MHK8_9PLEO|nr:class I glutamine amidotransferase-like protein [Massariosphaeria phaeospora]